MAYSMQSVSELLPDVVHEMIDQVGFKAVEQLVKSFGGVSFRFSDGKVYYPRLVALIGQEKAQLLRGYFAAEIVYIPRCETALRTLRNLIFKADYDYLTQEKKLSGRMAMLELCPKYGISDRLGWSLVASQPQAATQSALF